MGHYRKKPVVIEAVQFIDGSKENLADLLRFCPSLGVIPALPYEHDLDISIKTLEGVMQGRKGDWLIKGVKGEFYFCKPDIFEATYELVEAQPDAEKE